MNPDNKIKIALFLCDENDLPTKEKFGSYSDMFRREISRMHKNMHITTFRCHLGDELPQPEEYDGYIISGSRNSVYEELPWIAKLKEFIRQCWQQQIRMVGICFGHQLLAESLGGKTLRAQQGWGFGVHQVSIIKPKFWMRDCGDDGTCQYNIIVIHQDQVAKIPEGFEVIAKSDFCPVGMMQGGDIMLGIQGHPEFSIDFCSARAQARRKCIGEQKYQEAIHSLQHFKPDSDMVLRWIIYFLSQDKKNTSQNVQ